MREALLDAWLRKRQVASGEARRSAENRLESKRSRTRARDALPGAWRALTGEPDGLLCDLLEDRVRAMVGIEPQRSDIEDFLRHLPASRPTLEPAERSPSQPRERSIPQNLRERTAGDGGFRQCVSAGASVPIVIVSGTGFPAGSNCVTGETTSTAVEGIRVKGDTDAESDETVIATLSLRGSNSGVRRGPTSRPTIRKHRAAS